MADAKGWTVYLAGKTTQDRPDADSFAVNNGGYLYLYDTEGEPVSVFAPGAWDRASTVIAPEYRPPS